MWLSTPSILCGASPERQGVHCALLYSALTPQGLAPRAQWPFSQPSLAVTPKGRNSISALLTWCLTESRRLFRVCRVIHVHRDQILSLNTGGVEPTALSPASRAAASLAMGITLDRHGTGRSPRCRALYTRYQLGTGHQRWFSLRSLSSASP